MWRNVSLSHWCNNCTSLWSFCTPIEFRSLYIDHLISPSNQLLIQTGFDMGVNRYVFELQLKYSLASVRHLPNIIWNTTPHSHVPRAPYPTVLRWSSKNRALLPFLATAEKNMLGNWKIFLCSSFSPQTQRVIFFCQVFMFKHNTKRNTWCLTKITHSYQNSFF